jgi:hypothetical protein
MLTRALRKMAQRPTPPPRPSSLLVPRACSQNPTAGRTPPRGHALQCQGLSKCETLTYHAPHSAPLLPPRRRARRAGRPQRRWGATPWPPDRLHPAFTARGSQRRRHLPSERPRPGRPWLPPPRSERRRWPPRRRAHRWRSCRPKAINVEMDRTGAALPSVPQAATTCMRPMRRLSLPACPRLPRGPGQGAESTVNRILMLILRFQSLVVVHTHRTESVLRSCLRYTTRVWRPPPRDSALAAALWVSCVQPLHALQRGRQRGVVSWRSCAGRASRASRLVSIAQRLYGGVLARRRTVQGTDRYLDRSAEYR